MKEITRKIWNIPLNFFNLIKLHIRSIRQFAKKNKLKIY